METYKAFWTLDSEPCLILLTKASHMAEVRGRKLSPAVREHLSVTWQGVGNKGC